MKLLSRLFVLAIACAGPSALAQTDLPVELTDAEKATAMQTYGDRIAESRRLGRAVFDADQAVAGAMAHLEAEGAAPDPRIAGWVARPDGESYRVLGIGEAGGDPVLVSEMRTRDGQAVEGSYVSPGDGKLTGHEEAAYRATVTAATADFDRCGETYKAVVVDNPERGFDVFMLLPMDDMDQVMVGGNALVHVVDKGRKIEDVRSFTRSCLVLGAPSMLGGGRPASVTASDVLAEAPTALHVFLSLQHQLPVFVLTSRNQIFWRVDGDSIEPLQKYPATAR